MIRWIRLSEVCGIRLTVRSSHQGTCPSVLWLSINVSQHHLFLKHHTNSFCENTSNSLHTMAWKVWDMSFDKGIRMVRNCWSLDCQKEVYFAYESHCYPSANKQSSNTFRDQNSLILPSKFNSKHLSCLARGPVEDARFWFQAMHCRTFPSVLKQRFMKCI